MQQLIIDQPSLQRPRQRVLWGLVTVGFWVLWLYLWLPLISFIAWLFGLYRSYHYMVVLGGYHEVIRVLAYYLIIIMILGGGLALWAFVQWLRFRNLERRKHLPPAAPEALAAFYGLAPEDIKLWQTFQRAIAHHDGQGRLSFIRELLPGEPGFRRARTAPEPNSSGVLIEHAAGYGGAV